MGGQKHDSGKDDWARVPFGALSGIVKALTYGATLYSEDYDNPNWQKVENPRHRYFAALMRHLTAWRCGERCDQKSKLPHLWHAGANVLFLIWATEEGATSEQGIQRIHATSNEESETNHEATSGAASPR